jgi:drug/metabolite transporter (DMT)-like permease
MMPKRKLSLPGKPFLKTVLVSGLALGAVNVINVYVSGVLPGIIVFPCVNGGGIIASAIMARILIREKLSIRKKIGVVIGVIAICLIAL